MSNVDGFSMKNQTFREYATTWIYLLAATHNTLAIVPCGDQFAYEFKWEPQDGAQPQAGRMQRSGE